MGRRVLKAARVAMRRCAHVHTWQHMSNQYSTQNNGRRLTDLGMEGWAGVLALVKFAVAKLP